MPERAEAEVIKNDISAITSNWQLADIKVLCNKIKIDKSMLSKVIGDSGYCVNWSCSGKQIVAKIGKKDNFARLVFGLGMTGHFSIEDSGDTIKSRHPRLSLIYRDGENVRQLVFCDTRKFGRVYITDSKDSLLSKDALDIGPSELADNERDALFESHLKYYVFDKKVNRSIKSFLLEQKAFAGYGNYMACEALFRSKIHPATKIRDLTRKNIADLRKETFDLVSEMIFLGGVTLKDFVRPTGKPGSGSSNLKVYGRRDKLCVECGTFIKYVKMAGRGTFYCPHCQLM